MEVLFGVLLAMAVLVVVLAAKRGAEAAQRERHASLREVSARPSSAPGSIGARAPAGSALSALGPGRERHLGSALTGAAPAATNREPGVARPPRRSPTARTPEATSPRAPAGISSPAPETPSGPRPEPDSWWDTSARPSSRAPSRPAPRREAPPIDLNTASVDELQGLPGIGVRAANRIVEHRARHGRFNSVDDLEAVEGFDRYRVARLDQSATV